jgi:uncharacterized protein
MKPKNAIILHGTMGSPEGNWFAWLKSELEARGIETWLPELPHPEHPSLREESEFVRANCPFAIGSDTLVIGHSSGAILALILAQQNAEPIGGVVAVSVFHDNALNWVANDRLFDLPFDWRAIKANTPQLLFIHSDNDRYVPLDQAKFVADHCATELIVVPGQGHFNLEQSADYVRFPKLMDILSEQRLV